MNYFYFIENRENVRKLYFPKSILLIYVSIKWLTACALHLTNCNDRPNFLMCLIGMITYLLQEFVMKMKHVNACKALGTGHDTFQVLNKIFQYHYLVPPCNPQSKINLVIYHLLPLHLFSSCSTKASAALIMPSRCAVL